MDLHLLTFFALMMSFLSLWIYKSPWLWGSFLVIAYTLALQSAVTTTFTLIPLGTLFLLHFLLKKFPSGKERLLLFFAITLISTLLIFHKIPGFSKWNVGGNLWLNFDRPFTGLFVLALTLPLIRSYQEWINCSLKTIPLTLITLMLLIFLAVQGGVVFWEPKWPPHFLLRLISTFCLVAIPEEAFFRGFVQEEVEKWVGGKIKGPVLAILATSLFFTLTHVNWTSSFALLGFVFLASLAYGSIYRYTRKIESSIFCHFMVNGVHMIFFTYHTL